MADVTEIAGRFWPKVKKTDGCWLWVASKNAKGYGQLNVDRRPIVAHRISWRIHFGEIPKGIFVLHRCDNPACVRPDHLWLGSKADNNADMRAKNRHGHGAPRGEKQHNSKLTEAEVREIRALYDNAPRRSISLRKVAAKYGVHPVAIWYVVTRRSWAHIS